MMTRIVVVSCALAIALGGCNKDKTKRAEPDPSASSKEPTPATPKEPVPPPPKSPTADERINAYQACYAAVNAKDWAKLGACYAEHAESTTAVYKAEPAKGRDQIVERGIKSVAAAMPDWQIKPQLILQNGNKVASVAVSMGTHTGPLATPLGVIPPSKKKVGVYLIHIAQQAPDKVEIEKEWVFEDSRTELRQIGALKGGHRPPLDKAPEVTVVQAKNDATEKANLAVYNQSVDAFNKHDANGFDALLADGYRNIYATEAADLDRKGKKQQHTETFQGLPDLRWDPIDVWAAGDYVIATGHIVATNSGTFPGVPQLDKTGKKIDLVGVEIMKFVGGKATEHWEFLDGTTISVQLGLIPEPKP